MTFTHLNLFCLNLNICTLHIDQSRYVCCWKRDVRKSRLNWLDPCTGSLYWILVLDPCTGSLYWILVLDPCTGTLYWILVLDRIKKQQYLGVHSFVSCRLAGEKLVNFCIWQLIDWECGKPFHFNYSFKFFKPSKTPVHFKFQGHLQAARARASSTVHRQTT